jgi:hypothetical protein
MLRDQRSAMTEVPGSKIAPSSQEGIVNDRRRTGRVDSVSTALLPLLRNPTEGAVAGDLRAVARFEQLRTRAGVCAPGHYDLYDMTGSRFHLQTKCMSGDQLPYAPHGWFWLLANERSDAAKSPSMRVASVDAETLADQAARCRRPAGGKGDGKTKATSLALAIEYEVSYASIRMNNEMTEAEATVRDAIANAMMISGYTGLRAGPSCDRLIDAIIGSLLDPLVARAVRDLDMTCGPGESVQAD